MRIFGILLIFLTVFILPVRAEEPTEEELTGEEIVAEESAEDATVEESAVEEVSDEEESTEEESAAEESAENEIADSLNTRRTMFTVETDEESAVDSLNRISGEVDTFHIRSERSSSDSTPRYKPGPFGRKDISAEAIDDNTR